MSQVDPSALTALNNQYKQFLLAVVNNLSLSSKQDSNPEYENMKSYVSISKVLYLRGWPLENFDEDDFYYLASASPHVFAHFKNDDFEKIKRDLPSKKCGGFFVLLSKKYDSIWEKAKNNIDAFVGPHSEKEDLRIKTLKEVEIKFKELFDALLNLIKRFPDTPVEMLGELI